MDNQVWPIFHLEEDDNKNSQRYWPLLVVHEILDLEEKDKDSEMATEALLSWSSATQAWILKWLYIFLNSFASQNLLANQEA